MYRINISFLFPVWCLVWYRTIVYLTPPFLILLCMHVYLCRYKLIVWCLRIGLNGADHRHCRWRRRNATYSKANQSAYSQKNLRANLWAQKFIFRRLRRFKLVSQSIDGRIIPRIRIRCRSPICDFRFPLKHCTVASLHQVKVNWTVDTSRHAHVRIILFSLSSSSSLIITHTWLITTTYIRW